MNPILALAVAAAPAAAQLPPTCTPSCLPPAGCAGGTLQTVCFTSEFPGPGASGACAPGFEAPPWDSSLPPPALASAPILLPRFDPASVPSCARLLQAELQFELAAEETLSASSGTLNPCIAMMTFGIGVHVANPALGPLGVDLAATTTQLVSLPLAPGAMVTMPLTTVVVPDVLLGAAPICVTDPGVLASEFVANATSTTLRIDHGTAWILISSCSTGSIGFAACARVRARVLYTYCTASTPGLAFCAGDGLDPLVTTPCPCANFGAPGRGCANSANANGAALVATGCALATPEDVVLHASGLPSASTATFFAGDQAVLAGVPFFDGVRCADGLLVRLGTNTGSAGGAQYPLAGQPALSVRGNSPPGSGLLRTYQASYRNAAASFCPPATANVTNGYRIVW